MCLCIPASTCSPAQGLDLSRLFFFFVFFAEDFSACAAYESAPVAFGSQPSASRVRVLLVGPFWSLFPSSKVAYPSSRPPRPRYPRIWRPVYIRDPCWVLSRCRSIETYQRRSVVSSGGHIYARSQSTYVVRAQLSLFSVSAYR